MQSRVRRDLAMLDSSLFTDEDLEDWLNEGQEELARETSWYRTSETMGTVAGTKEYALPLPTAGRCIRIEEVRYGTLQLATISMQQLLDWDWFYRQAGNGTPYLYYVRGSSGFGLHYTPDTTNPTNLLVVFTAVPPQVTAPNETFYVPHGLERGLIIYAKKLASEKDITGEGQRRFQMYEGQWQQFLKEARDQVNKVAERQVTVVGEQGLYDEIAPAPQVGWRPVVP
jgi:hypothetical protein